MPARTPPNVTEERGGLLRAVGFTRLRGALLRLVGILCVLTLHGCGDRERDDAIQALGPETPGVRVGPLHRPGQPCLLCHSQSGNAQPFLLAGTVYVNAVAPTPLDDVKVIAIDSRGQHATALSNCAGNFVITGAQFAPDAPVWFSLERDQVIRDMDTAVYREGSCAACHRDPIGAASVGHVYLIEDPVTEGSPQSHCP